MNYSKLIVLIKKIFLKITLIAFIIQQNFFINKLYAQELPIIADVSSNTQISKTELGVDQINIATPNSSGLSHNKFESYNVNLDGQILNNISSKNIENQSNLTEIGGKINPNPNLESSVSAKIILNEVISSNTSKLLGFVEIAGPKADLIIANPNGITCNGCGFINTSKLTLIAGNSSIEGDNLKFNLKEQINSNLNIPLITVEGLGLNANKTSATEIIASTVKILSSIYGGNDNSITIKTGEGNVIKNSNNEFEISQTNQLNSNIIDSQNQLFAIDLSSLAKIQAGQIYLIATKEGVGVKMEGEVLASKSLKIDANGDIYYDNISATNQITIQSSNSINSLNDKSLATAENIDISSKNLDNLGTIFGKNIDLKNINKIDNYGNIEASNLKFLNIDIINNYKNIFGLDSLQISTNKLYNYSNSIISSDYDYVINNKNIFYNHGLVFSKNNLEINIGDNLECLLNNYSCNSNENEGIFANYGKILTNNNFKISSTNYANNFGIIQTNHELDIITRNIENKEKITADNIGLLATNIHNSKEILSKNDITIIGENLENSGELLSGNNQFLYLLNNLNNTGDINAKNNININGANEINNFKNILSNNDIFVSATTFNNYNIIKSNNELHLNLYNLSNNGDIFAKEFIDISTSISTINNKILKSANNLAIKSETLTNNNSSLILAENNINIYSTNINNNNNKPSQEINSGIVSSNGAINIKSNNLNNNSGFISGKSALFETLNSESPIIDNLNGEIVSTANINLDLGEIDYILTGNMTANSINITANNIKNEGNILAFDFIKLNASGNSNNSNDGNIINGFKDGDNSNIKLSAGNYIDFIAKKNIENFATISTNKKLTLTSSFGSINNHNSIKNNNDEILINAVNGDFNNLNINSSISSNNNAEFNAKNLNNSGSIISGNNLKMNISNNFINTASIKSNNNAIFNVADEFLNNQGKIHVKNNLIIQKNDLSENANIFNNISGEIETYNGDITINAKKINNSRSSMKTQKYTYWQSECNQQDDGCYYDSSYIASISGKIGGNSIIDSGKNIFLNSDELTNNSSTIEASNDLNINPTIIKNINNNFEAYQNYSSNWNENEDPYANLISTKPSNFYKEEYFAYLSAGNKLNFTQLDLTNPILLNSNNIKELTSINENSLKTSTTEFSNIANYILNQKTTENIDLSHIDNLITNNNPLIDNDSQKIMDNVNSKLTNSTFKINLALNHFNPKIMEIENLKIPNSNIFENSLNIEIIENKIEKIIIESKDIVADIDRQTRISDLKNIPFIEINDNFEPNNIIASTINIIPKNNNLDQQIIKILNNDENINIDNSLTKNDFNSQISQKSNLNKDEKIKNNAIAEKNVEVINTDNVASNKNNLSNFFKASIVDKNAINNANLNFNFVENSRENANSLISKIISKNNLKLSSNIETIKTIGNKFNLSNSLNLNKIKNKYLKYYSTSNL